ncbi:pantetheine-phosphate adenylyltransferase [Finegoldia magna]|uniref:pantetheine-phosphate adenylyltransferase n=1 Tax=Finegoldia magna TaxID=1260 RepID=UPI0029073C66|nr:pantetheine-phosphate adenylyltransferase [Finegoldia magna]MDU4731595.1 pantetheine-phosphate adenylyltransferase [Finegoldia magna]
MNKTKVLYPGSFDPITNGHMDIIERSAKIFEEVNVAVVKNIQKKSTFTLEQRVEMIEKACKHLSNVKIHQFEGLPVDFAKQIGCSTIIRGLRAVSDFESEMQMSLANKKLNDELETLFLVADGKYAFLSSSIVREIASYGADISELVPENIVEDIKRRFNDK